MNKDIQKHIKQFFYSLGNTYNFSQPYSILVALSGGQDSVALLLLLKQLELEYSFCTVVAGHVVHNMQEKVAQSNEIELVDTLCSFLNIPLYREHIAERENNDTTKDSLAFDIDKQKKTYNETDARTLRYACLQSIAKKYTIPVIATAHHRDDTIETLLMRFLKAEGIRGMKGIPAISVLGTKDCIEHTTIPISIENDQSKTTKKQHYPHTLLVRPLLSFSKNQLAIVVKEGIASLKKENSIAYHYDKSNADNTIFRNKVRNLLVPTLQDIVPNFDASMLTIMQDIQQLLYDTGQRDYYNMADMRLLEEKDNMINSKKINITNIERTPYPWFISGENICIEKENSTIAFISDKSSSLVLQLHRTFFFRCNHTQKIHILLLAANYLGIRRISKRLLEQCVTAFNTKKKDKKAYFSIQNTVLQIGLHYLRWQKNISLLLNSVGEKTQKLSDYIVEKSVQAVFNKGMWHITPLKYREHKDSTKKLTIPYGIEYTLYYKNVLILTQLHKYDTIITNNVKLTIKNILSEAVWVHVIAIKENNNIIMVPTEYFLKRTLIDDSVLYKENEMSLLYTRQNNEYSNIQKSSFKRCKIIVSYHSLHIIL